MTALVLASVAGCGHRSPATTDERSPTGRRASAGSSAALVKEGCFGIGGGFHARLEIQRVERYADKSVLRFFVTSLEAQEVTSGVGPSTPAAPLPSDGETLAPGSTKAWPMIRTA